MKLLPPQNLAKTLKKNPRNKGKGSCFCGDKGLVGLEVSDRTLSSNARPYAMNIYD